MSNSTEKRKSVIESINKPLGFFALALLIVEVFLATVLIGSSLEISQKIIGLWIGVGLFVLVVIIVSIFVWFKPRNLMYDQFGHLADSGKILYGSSDDPLTSRTLETLPQNKEKN